MDLQLKEDFSSQWAKYFGKSDLPITYHYTDTVTEVDRRNMVDEARCLIGNLNSVRVNGGTYVYDAKTPGCPGGKRYSGFIDQLMPGFEYFLSCGIPGKMEGERYKKTPELVHAFLEANPPFEAPGKYLVFKRWDQLLADDAPLAVIFFAAPDVLSGLFTLANYDRASGPGVVAPMGAGCATLLQYPMQEARSEQPRCVLGMFDVSARPCVPADTLTFTIPFKRFEQMVANMDESFLITASWQAVKVRLPSAN